MNSDTTNSVKVEIKGFYGLVTMSHFPLALDCYQRPYVWSQDKVTQLLNDLIEFQTQVVSHPHRAPASYYMGTLLFHENDESQNLFIIDGQQRITTLCVLFYILHGHLPDKLELSFNSAISAANIAQTQQICRNYDQYIQPETLSRIQFTCISVKEEDLAFTFFDTQNNRGVPLAATDLLKAHHLRAIAGNTLLPEVIQEHSASRWENIQGKGGGGDFAQYLFGPYLWRGRNWRGSRVKVRENLDDILSTFQKETLNDSDSREIPLYANSSNQWARAIKLTDQNKFHIELKPLVMESNTTSLPFSIRQPLHSGVGFFLYAEKYATLLEELQSKPTEVKGERVDFHRFCSQVLDEGGLSGYLKNLFWIAVLMYVDQFEDRKLTEFAEALDYSLGALRIGKASILKETPVKYLRDSSQNLLDIIAGAYRPDEVISFLRNDKDAAEVYSRSDIAELIVKGVRLRYANAVKSYYNNSGWKNRRNWATRSTKVDK